MKKATENGYSRNALEGVRAGLPPHAEDDRQERIIMIDRLKALDELLVELINLKKQIQIVQEKEEKYLSYYKGTFEKEYFEDIDHHLENSIKIIESKYGL